MTLFKSKLGLFDLVQLLLILQTTVIVKASDNCPDGKRQIGSYCFTKCNGCNFNKQCKKCTKDQTCVINGSNNSICKDVPNVKLIDSCISYAAQDQTSLRNNGYKCIKCDEQNGYYLHKFSKRCINVCTICFDPDFRGTCKICPKETVCTYDTKKLKGFCFNQNKDKIIKNCEQYEIVNHKNEDLKCRKCKIGFAKIKDGKKCIVSLNTIVFILKHIYNRVDVQIAE